MPSTLSEDTKVCSSARNVGIIVSRWDSVVASQGATDHEETIEELSDDLDDLIQQDSSESPCTGAVELVNFNFELAKLRVAVTTGATEEDYQDTTEAGNEWVEVIEPEREYEFSSGIQ